MKVDYRYPVVILAVIFAICLLAGAGTPTGPAGLSVKDYGAIGNGAADDTTPIQNAMNAAITQNLTLYFPPGSYRTTRTLDLSRPTGRHYASLKGASMQGVQINYDGDPLNPILRIKGGFGIDVADLTLRANNPARKPQAGISFPADDQHGSSMHCTFTRLFVENAKVGFDFNRGSNRQVSEMTLTGCLAAGCDEAAFRVEGWNALNYLFLNCYAYSSGVGWLLDRTNSVTIMGGGASSVQVGVKTASGGIVTVRGARFETSRRLADLGPVMPDGSMGMTGAPVQATFEGCLFQGYAGELAPDGAAVRISNPGPTRIKDCLFWSGDIAYLRNKDTVVTIEGTSFDKKFAHGVRAFGGGTGGLLTVKNCRVVDWATGGAPVGLLNVPGS